MTKLVAFPVPSHRFYQTPNLDAQLQILSIQSNTNPKLKDLISLSEQNEKLKLLLKVMVTHESKALNNPIYQARLADELTAIINHPTEYLLDFFLIYEDIAYFFIAQNQIANIGRGSAAGSLVNYLLGITKVDPVKYNLLFERFLFPNSAPDIDFDCANKDELIKYLSNKYGANLQQVKTTTKWRLKPALLAITADLKYARSHHFLTTVDKFSMLRETDLSTKLASETQLFNFICDHDRHFREYFDLNPAQKAKLLSLLDQPKNEAKHPAGYVLSDTPNTHIDFIDQNKIIKLDFLTLTSYAELNKKYKLSDLANISITPEGLLHQISLPLKNEGLGVSARTYYQSLSKDTKAPQSLLEVAVMFSKGRESLYYILDNMKPTFQDPRVDEVLAETSGELIFQEQLMVILQKCLRVELTDSLEILRAISKEDPVFNLKKAEYIKQMGDNGQEIMEFLLLLTPKLFNKSHAVSYSLIDYYLAN